MNLLTIDPKDNCYVINEGQMNDLQERVANSITLDRGTYDIRIESGRYSYASAKTEGEPFVFLWIYGINGNTFINKNTGFETGATWKTLNGYQDTLTLEVKEKAVICALFFDVDKTDNSGAVTLSIKSANPSFIPRSLTVDSKQNCYVLDESYLSSLKQWDSNYNELKPGKYEIKIRDGKASYWSDSKKFELEPWALIWVKGGKFITKQTGVEIEETWCSLNGYNDKVVLEVKEKTTLCGLFFDTYKEDNEGKITLSIDRVIPASPVIPSSYGYVNISFDTFARNPQTDIVCVSPIRTVVRREEEIILIRKVRKVEEVDASPACPVNTTQISQVQQEGQTIYTESKI